MHLLKAYLQSYSPIYLVNVDSATSNLDVTRKIATHTRDQDYDLFSFMRLRHNYGLARILEEC
jgi:hypothetical protein